MKIEIFKNYLEEKGLEINEIDLGDKEICDIKSNPVLLAEFYIKYFNEFRKIFSSFESAKDLIDKHEKIFIEVFRLSCYKNYESEFGKSRSGKLLENFVIDNYNLITEFFDFWLEVNE